MRYIGQRSANEFPKHLPIPHRLTGIIRVALDVSVVDYETKPGMRRRSG